MSLSSEELDKGLEEYWLKPVRKLLKEKPHLFEPVRILVVEDDGTETDLCDISRPLSEIMEGIGK